MATMMLAEQSDRRKNPEQREYRPMTLEEAKALSYGEHPHVILKNGRVGVVKVNGMVKRWKREPDRIDVPVKYGMYECATFVNQPDGTVASCGMPSCMFVVAI